MISSNFRIKIDRSRLATVKQIPQKVIEMTGEAVHTDVVQAEVVPRDTNATNGFGFTVDTRNSKNGEVSLKHSTPYARKIYFHPEWRFRKTENAHAQGLWFRHWITGAKKNFAYDAYKKFFKQELNK